MKLKWLLALILLVPLVLPSAPAWGQKSSTTQTITATGGKASFVNFYGGLVASFEEVPTGTVSAVTITVQGCMKGGTCAAASDTYSGTTASIRGVTFPNVYDYFLVTATWTGSGTWAINATITTAAESGGGSSGPPSGAAGGVLSGNYPSPGAANPFPAIAFTCGTLNITSCVLTGYGSTSGTATLTWPAVAGTTTNPVVSSNWFQTPGLILPSAGAETWNSDTSISRSAANTIQIGNTAGTPNASGNVVAASYNAGVYDVTALTSITEGAIELYDSSGIPKISIYTGSGTTLSSDLSYGWGADAGHVYPADTSISRASANVVQIGNTGGTPDASGTLKAAGIISAGTTFTSSGGLDETTLVGGATAGQFTTATLTTGSTVITMGASVPAAPHGWHCAASDQTHPLDIIVGTSASTTTCKLTVAVAITIGDVIEFSAIGY